jgi:Domain of unknown function (DUF4440)
MSHPGSPMTSRIVVSLILALPLMPASAQQPGPHAQTPTQVLAQTSTQAQSQPPAQARAQSATNGPCTTPALINQQKDAATIRHLETSWNTAITQGDATFEDCLLTADFMEILSNGELKTRTDELAFTTKNKGQHKPPPQLPPFTIVIHGDVAMAHATWTSTASKRPPDKIVDYFIWENGSWHVFFSQSTPIEAQKKVSLRWLALFHPSPTRAHDHPLARALLEEIHPNEIPAGVFPVPSPLLGNTAARHGNIAEDPHFDRTILKRLEFVMKGREVL